MTGRFDLETAIDKAMEEFLSLEKEAQTPVNVAMLADKYAPKTINHMLDCLFEHKWMFLLDLKPGWRMKDGILATIVSYMSSVLMSRWEETAKEEAMRQAKATVLRDKLGGRA